MPAIAMTLNTKPFEAQLALLGKRGPVALARGLNRTATSERTAMARGVSKDMGIKVGTARDAMKIEKASASSLVARVVARGKRLPIIDFRASGRVPTRGRGPGVSYVMRGQRKRIPNAFIATTSTQADGSGGSHRGVFIRASTLSRVSRGGWGKNLPIKQLYGPSIAHVFATLMPLGEARRAEVLMGNVSHELSFELSRLTA